MAARRVASRAWAPFIAASVLNLAMDAITAQVSKFRLRCRMAALWAIAFWIVAAAASGEPARAEAGSGAEWARVVAAARAEGQVIVSGGQAPSARNGLMDAWSKDFPDIRLNYVPAGSFDWVNRVKAERSSGKYEWDVHFGGANVQVYNLSAGGTYEPFAPTLFLPELKDPGTWQRPWDEMFLDRAKRIFGPMAQPSSIWYDAKAVDPAKVERLGLRILLDPAYKGRIAWQDPRIVGPGSNFALLIHEMLGRDALKTILVDQEPVFYGRAIQATEAMYRGKADIVVDMAVDVIADYEKAGIVRDLRPIGTDAKTAYLSFGGAVLALFNRAPHPNAARLFINWVLTREVQEKYSRATSWNSRRTDVPSVLPPRMRYVPGERYIEAQSEQWVERRSAVMAYVHQLRPQ